MRLDVEEQKTISSIVKGFCSGSGVLYLYGSRVDESKRGGDIDLLLVVGEEDKDFVEKKIHYLLTDIKEAIGHQRIDFTVLTESSIKDNPFYQMIIPTAITLDKWD